MTTLKQTGQCLCGKVKFAVDGDVLFNTLCHCRACSRARGMSPVHLIGVKGDVTYSQGQDLVKVVPGNGAMEHAFCSACGGGIYQKPAGAGFHAVFPVSFQLETETEGQQVPSCVLPTELMPKMHTNYENRLMNHYDSLPKYKAFPPANKMTNQGEIIP